jgi:hypothetical protein
MADELEADVDVTYELIRDYGLRFERQGWRMYQHIFNRTIRAFLTNASGRPWQKKPFRDAMLGATKRIRDAVLDEVGDKPVDKPTFKRIAIEEMKKELTDFLTGQKNSPTAAGESSMLGPVCTDYLRNPDDPPPE